jgi:hypothetical protein
MNWINQQQPPPPPPPTPRIKVRVLRSAFFANGRIPTIGEIITLPADVAHGLRVAGKVAIVE